MMALNSGFLDRSVHALDLAVRPWMLDLRQPMFDVIFPAAQIEHMRHVSCCRAIRVARRESEPDPPVDVLKALQIAATINRQAFMLVVDAKGPYRTVPDLTAAMKLKGSYATAAPSGIVMGEMYKAITGVKAVEVRYKDAVGSLNELMDGKLDYGMHDPVFSLAQQREGRLRILAHSSGQRLNAVPDMPTMAEFGVPGMDLTSWWALHVPTGTPAPVIAALNGWMKQVLEMEETKQFLNQFGGDPFINTPEVGQALFIKDEKSWGDYVRLAAPVGLQLEPRRLS